MCAPRNKTAQFRELDAAEVNALRDCKTPEMIVRTRLQLLLVWTSARARDYQTEFVAREKSLNSQDHKVFIGSI